MPVKQVLVLGVGNVERGDEGFGIQAVRKLAACVSNPAVEMMEGGTMGLALLPKLERRRTVIVMESLDFGGQPGDLVKLKGADLAGIAKDSETQRILRDCLAEMELRECQPAELWFFGCQPAISDAGHSLSDPVTEALERLVEQVQVSLK